MMAVAAGSSLLFGAHGLRPRRHRPAFVEPAVNAFRSQRKRAVAEAGGVVEGVRQRRGHRVDAAFGHPLRPQWPDGIRRVDAEHLGAGDVGIARDAVIAEVGVRHDALRVDVVILGQRESDSLGDAAFHLSPDLCGIDDDRGVGCLDAVKDADLTRDPVDGDAEALRMETTLRAEPWALRAAVKRIPRARAAATSSASDTRRSPQTTLASSIEHITRWTPVWAAANSSTWSRTALAAQKNRVARHEESGARERAGVESRAVGVGLHQANP